MKQVVSPAIKSRVVELRQRFSIREVAAQTNLPVGTVKTICHRSGLFHDNKRLRALCTLPPTSQVAERLPAVPKMPSQKVVTGDNEVDAVLWLRECIATGQTVLIDLALNHAKKITTPLQELQKRYSAIVQEANPGNVFATICTLGFAELEELAEKSKKNHALRHEALSRFGNSLFERTEAERYCIDTLQAVEADESGRLDDVAAGNRFKNSPAYLPHTLADCLHELQYWDRLRELRYAVNRDSAEFANEVYARENFVFSCLGKLRPRSKEEALMVLRWMLADKQNRFNDDQVDYVLPNLIV